MRKRNKSFFGWKILSVHPAVYTSLLPHRADVTKVGRGSSRLPHPGSLQHPLSNRLTFLALKQKYPMAILFIPLPKPGPCDGKGYVDSLSLSAPLSLQIGKDAFQPKIEI
jgi:hypothetical protein